MTGLLTILFLILIISIVVFVHEFGHFSVAKFFKMTVHEFAIGFGKVLFQKKYKGTKYSIRAIPFGGFVELEGENDRDKPDSFRNRPFYQKAAVLVAGVVMNIILAIFLLTAYLNTNGFRFVVPNLTDYTFTNVSKQEAVFPITITNVSEGGRSEGILEPGEMVVAINNNYFKNPNEFASLLDQNQGQEIAMTFLNIDNFDTYSKTLNLGYRNEEGALLDVMLNTAGSPIYLIKYNENLTSGVSMTYDVFVYQAKALGGIISRSFSTGDYTELSNTVGGLPQVTDQINTAIVYDAISFLIPLTALISISLAFFNILPFPALDGGQLVVAAIEAITRKKIPDPILNRINLTGFIILMAFGLLVTLKDIIQLGWVNSVVEFFRNIAGR